MQPEESKVQSTTPSKHHPCITISRRIQTSLVPTRPARQSSTTIFILSCKHTYAPPFAEVLLLQHGFRLLWAFAHKSAEWPEASNKGSGSILMNQAMPIHVSRLSDNRQFVPCSSCEFWWKRGPVANEALQSLGWCPL